jgi:hypothetical protein
MMHGKWVGRVFSGLIKVVFIVCISASIGACSGIKVKLTTDKIAQIPMDSTYKWDSAPLHKSSRIDRRTFFIDQQLHKQIDLQMQQKGLRLVAADAAATWLIGYRLASSVRIDQGGIISPRDESERILQQGVDDMTMGNKFYDHPIASQLETIELIIALQDVANKQIVWEATVSRIAESGQISEEKLQAAIREAVSKAFKRFPKVL